MMTAEHISDQCGEITVRVNNSMNPMPPLFHPILHIAKPYTQNKTSTGRPLMMPDEVRRLAKDQGILLIRGSKPLKLSKITPEEHPFFEKLKPCKAIDHIPDWKKREKSAPVAQSDPIIEYQVRIPMDPEPDTSDEVQLDAQDMAAEKPLRFTCSKDYVYKKASNPKNV